MSQNLTTESPISEAEKWFKTETWKNGLELNADPSTDVAEFYRQYHANKTLWDQAFAFLKDQDLETIKPGKYPIDGEDVFASVSEQFNFELDKTTWESHRKYNDIQYVIKGGETIGITDPSTATVTVDYNEMQDITFYNAEGTLHSFQPGVFFIFFPQNLHRPCIKAGAADTVKKIVLKIRTAG
ncbi:MAG: YhcH/YjgK/YiaL family protein [Chitinophagaceae bacterium]